MSMYGEPVTDQISHQMKISFSLRHPHLSNLPVCIGIQAEGQGYTLSPSPAMEIM